MNKSNFRLSAGELARALAALALALAVASPPVQAQSGAESHSSRLTRIDSAEALSPEASRLAAGQIFSGKAGKLSSLFAPKEPLVVDANRAYPTVSALPGAPFSPVSYATDSIIAQLAHSSTGVVRLPPGDYSIPVHLY